MFYQDFSAGDVRQPESAARYNAVNRLLNSAEDIFPAESDRSCDGRVIVDFLNISDDTVMPFSPVSLRGSKDKKLPETFGNRFDGCCIVMAEPAERGDILWGISLDEVRAYEYGRVVLSGIVPAWFIGKGRCVSPEINGLTAGDSGSGAVICDPINYEGVIKKDSYPGIILLGGSGGWDSYNGTFKLLPVSQTEVKIIAGNYPDETDYAGGSDVPGFNKIPQLTLELAPDRRHRIYIYFEYDEELKAYSVHLGTEVPDGVVLYTYLGEFINGSVVQSYKANSYLKFSDIWYLTAGENA